MSLDAMSILIIIGYLLAIIITGGLVGRRLDLDGFLVNSRSTPGFLLVASMVSTNVGAATVIAVAAESYKTGISFGLTASGAVVGSLIVMAIVAPKLKTYGDTHSSTTIGEVFGSIYSRGAQVVSGSLVFA
ncbi:MAG: hypothetical protein IT307_20915, partial [Chloroflexi bacterium]|nr:hypothetical protein [Chloroflexota bacterium]